METSEWRRKCKFCCGTCHKNIRHPNQNNCHELPKKLVDTSEVTTLHFKEKVLLSYQKRNDQISKEVALRVRSRNDLVDVEAHYHMSCRITFMNPGKTFCPGEKKC